MTEPATYVARLTPPGAGAIAVLAVRGPHAWPALRGLFRPASGRALPAAPTPGAVWFGHAGDGAASDEVVLTVQQVAPQPWLELHCHGGRQVVDWLIDLLARRGLIPRPWPEFVASAGPNHPAAALLPRALTARTAAILLDQLGGAFERALRQIEQALHAGDHATALARAGELLSRAGLGKQLTGPWRVVIAGAPNVGKSSLVNALAGYQRSVVAPVAGTTRDVVSAALAIDGWPVELLDTAGLRDRAAGLEQAGVERAREALRDADLVVWLIDATVDVPDLPPDDLTDRLVVANKCDLTAARAQAADLRISALTGAGVEGLCAAISRKLVPDPPPPGAAVPVGAAQIQRLQQLRESLRA